MDSNESTWDLGAETRPSTPKRPKTRPACPTYLIQLSPTGPTLGTRVVLNEAPLTLGRAEDCGLCIKDDSVSRYHARIEPSTGGYYVVDLQSRNGVFINDQPATEARLRDGDYLRLGNCVFRFLSGQNVEAEYYEEIYNRSILDALTGVPNRRYLEEFLDQELAESVRVVRPLALVLFDIDGFKGINDERGHQGGDYTLRELTACIRRHIRTEDLLARYGGEEFALVLPGTGHPQAIEIAEGIRRQVERHPFSYEGRKFTVTISLGVASVSGKEPWNATELIRQADDKLYQAKRAGRNRVIA